MVRNNHGYIDGGGDSTNNPITQNRAINRYNRVPHAVCRTLDRNIRIGQINLQGSRACLEEITHIVRELEIDVMLIQEPYILRGKVPHLAGARAYFIEGNPKAATLVFNDNIEVLLLRELSSSQATTYAQ